MGPSLSDAVKYGSAFIVAALTIHFYLSAFGLAPSYFEAMNDRLYYFVRGLAIDERGGETRVAEEALRAEAAQQSAAGGLFDGDPSGTTTRSAPFAYGPAERPMRIEIERIGVGSEIVIPEGTDIPTLDAALEEGVVYYPGSGRLGEEGNMFLFAHSSWLPNIRNRNFSLFNGLRELNLEDRISVLSNNTRYLYEVTSVRAVSQEEAWVDFSQTEEPTLTLSSCNTFGKKEDRVVVEAVLIDEISL